MELDSTVSLEKFFTDIQSLLKIIESKPKDIPIDVLFGKVLEYYLTTNDKNTEYTLEQLEGKITETFGKDCEEKTFVDHSYYFMAYNGAYDETYRLNGIGDITDLNERVKEAFKKLEDALGKNEFDSDEEGIMLISNPITLMKNAIRFIPEKLWNGPLNEGDNTPEINTPIIIGETKTDYMMRIVKKKVESEIDSKEEIKQILEEAQIVCETFGSKRNKIAIIPKDQVSDLADNEEVRIFQRIKSDQFDTITILDKFELLQLTALLSGANKGDYIDPNTGEKVDPEKATERKTKKFKAKRKDVLIEEITPEPKQIENEKTENKNSSVDDFSQLVEEKVSELNEVKTNKKGDLYEFDIPDGHKFTFKPVSKNDSGEEELYKAYVQVAASQIQRLAQEETSVDCRLAFINDMRGIVEPQIQVNEKKTKALNNYFEKGTTLDLKIVKQLMREFVIDYCLCNYDSNSRNFVIDKNGNIRGLEKYHAFRYIDEPQIKGDYRLEYIPEEIKSKAQAIYGRLFKDIEEGNIPKEVLLETLEAAKKIMAIPEKQYRRTFEKYAEDVVKHNGGDKERLLNKICKRRESLNTALEHIGLDKKLNRYTIQGKILEFKRILNKIKK